MYGREYLIWGGWSQKNGCRFGPSLGRPAGRWSGSSPVSVHRSRAMYLRTSLIHVTTHLDTQGVFATFYVDT